MENALAWSAGRRHWAKETPAPEALLVGTKDGATDEATGDNHEAVVRGLSSTARVITSAALIMISVFGAFVLSDDPNGKLFGVGLAVAVLIDATLVRMVLVPATMSLLGRANWWLPGWLERILPHLDLEAAPGAPAVSPEPELTAA